jgi:diguanylate cyclase (GGDEF)-like protein
LSNQLDFILFFYGLAFILLGGVCISIADGPGQRYKPALLGFFALGHGVGEWLDLTALLAGDTPGFAVARTALMTGSFVLLTEFARQSAIGLGRRVPGAWIHVPAILLVGLGGAIGGLSAANAVARYAIGLVGALGTAWVFASRAKGLPSAPRRLAICAAAGFALYAIAAGLIVPAAPFWPASVLHQQWFARVTGFPIQLVRGLLAFGLAFCVWALAKYILDAELSSQRYTESLRQRFVWTFVSLVIVLAAGWMGTEILGETFEKKTQVQALGEIDVLASRLNGETAAMDGMAISLAGSPSVRATLSDGMAGGSRDRQLAVSMLNLDVAAARAKAGYLLDKAGGVIAISDDGETARLEAPMDGVSPCFRKSIAGEDGHQFSRDAGNGEPEYCASRPVRAGDGTVVGVAVLKKSLDVFAADLSRFDHPYCFIDPDGIILLTNRPAWRFRPMWPVPAEKKSMLARQFGTLADRPVLTQEVVDAAWVEAEEGRHFVRRRDASGSQWSLVLMMPSPGLLAGRVLGILLTLVMGIATLIYLFGRERAVRDHVEMERRQKLEDQARDLRVQATRDPLTGLYNRLKFDEALATEIARSTRHKTPFSLVLYDVDHFKAVNDTHGHQIGDRILVEVSRLVSARIRNIDLLARWGGEEFVILLGGCDGQTAYQVAEHLRAAIEEGAFGDVGSVSCSFGVAPYADGDDVETILARADAALYRAKINGRNRVELALRPASTRAAVERA